MTGDMCDSQEYVRQFLKHVLSAPLSERGFQLVGALPALDECCDQFWTLAPLAKLNFPEWRALITDIVQAGLPNEFPKDGDPVSKAILAVTAEAGEFFKLTALSCVADLFKEENFRSPDSALKWYKRTVHFIINGDQAGLWDAV